MLRRILRRLRYEASIPIPERAVQFVRSRRFKTFLLAHIRAHRLQFPEWNNGAGVDFTFFEARHSPTPPNRQLHDIANKAVQLMAGESDGVRETVARSPGLRLLYDYNNHYMLLTALGRAVGARKIVEIGTASGSSLWACLRSEKVEAVSTWDIFPLEKNTGWFQTDEIRQLVQAALASDPRWKQYVEDLLDPSVWATRAPLFRDADVIWIDGPHDPDTFERKLMENILRLSNEREILMVFDDIWLSDMVDFWRDLPLPKLDITPIGHQSGTGLALLLPANERNRKA